ncbi:MAG: malate dehydrogenase [Solirubrobacteraceae bacterium]
MSKVVIVGGGGGVGASVAFNLLIGGGEFDVVMTDRRPEMALSHVLDLEQVLEQGARGTVRKGSDDDIPQADILVVTASLPLTVNDSRMVYLEGNARIVTSVVDLLPEDWPGVLLLVTNPVDPLCTLVQRRDGLDRHRVLGYTINDSLRLRTGIGRVLGVAPGRITAWSIGEHGPLTVHLWDRVQLDGAAVTLDQAQREQVEGFVANWYVRHVALDSGRSSTWTSGLGVARMVSAIADGRAGIWPASVVLEGEYGISGVSLSVPVSLGPDGVAEIHEWELSAEQAARLRKAADYVRDVATT